MKKKIVFYIIPNLFYLFLLFYMKIKSVNDSQVYD